MRPLLLLVLLTIAHRASTDDQQAAQESVQLDVDKLNQLIKTMDKSWILPHSKEPVGSNFQYQKTCANIYKARHDACHQLGFGAMCFNYCYEQGEQLRFVCQDVSDAVYCRRGGSFNAALNKHRKDPYKAKAFIHQIPSASTSSLWQGIAVSPATTRRVVPSWQRLLMQEHTTEPSAVETSSNNYTTAMRSEPVHRWSVYEKSSAWLWDRVPSQWLSSMIDSSKKYLPSVF